MENHLGTAGIPILNILEKKELLNVVVIVTRYFGGTLLGTGGLVRAYSESTLKALENANYVIKEKGYLVEIELDYNEIEDLKKICRKNNILIVEEKYLEEIKIIIEISKEKYQKIIVTQYYNDFNKTLKCNILEEKYANSDLYKLEKTGK